jgi:hypothetical protein
MNEDNVKGYGCFVMVVSGLALLIALIALRRWDVPLCALKTSDFNVADIFSILVTVLIGWQVFNAIENHKTLRRMDRLQSQFERSNRLLELQDRRAMDLLEAFAQDRKGDNENELSAKYMCYLNAIHRFVKANVPGANLNLIDTEHKLEQTLSAIENSQNNFSRGVFISHIPTYEDTFREIMTFIHQRQEDLTALHTRMTRLRDERKRVCEAIQKEIPTNPD